LAKKIEDLTEVINEKTFRELDWREGVEPFNLHDMQKQLMEAVVALDRGKLSNRDLERYTRGFNLMKKLIERAASSLEIKDDNERHTQMQRRFNELSHAEYVLDQIMYRAVNVGEEDSVPLLQPEVMSDLWKTVADLDKK